MSTPFNKQSKKVRKDLAVKYVHKKAPVLDNTLGQGILTQYMPLLAMFLRNKYLAWFSLITQFYYYLTTPQDLPGNKDSSSNLDLPRILMCVSSIVFCYIDLIFPNEMSFKKLQDKVQV
ncbi:hypothetical protein ACO0RG_003533 [Hanseniaspora osmophila]